MDNYLFLFIFLFFSSFLFSKIIIFARRNQPKVNVEAATQPRYKEKE